MALTLIPDAELAVGAYLRTHDDIEALGARVLGKTPADTGRPWVRLTQLDAREAGNSRVEHLIGFLVQLDCYADTDNEQGDAVVLGRSVRAALNQLPNTIVSGAVVTRVEFIGHTRLPDPDFEPARERVIITAEIHMHAA
jgi:hypothetical protein